MEHCVVERPREFRLRRCARSGGELRSDNSFEIDHGKEHGSRTTPSQRLVGHERKGERLIVLHTLPDQELKETLTRFGEVDLPALWKPRPDQFRRIAAMPYLGTGKLDLRRVKELGNELA